MPLFSKPIEGQFELIGSASWASALINNDRSGLNKTECVALDNWVTIELGGDRSRVIDIKRDEHGESEDPWFTWNYNMFTHDEPLGGDVLTYTAV